MPRRKLSSLFPEPEYVHIGYGHADIIGALRPDLVYADRSKTGKRIPRRAAKVVTEIWAECCTCPAAHVEVFLRRI